jgi:hypothetical protein
VSRRVAEYAALAVVLSALVFCGWFRITGGHWERVESPSMGTTAPVGTLLWTRPVAPEDVEVGDIVSFQQPNRVDGPVYSHRIREVEADGTFRTRGDLSGDDQWVVLPSDLVGRVVWVWPGVGRLLQVAPVLLLGGVVTVGVIALARRRGRLPLAMLGASFTLSAAIVVYQPLIGAQLLSTEPAEDGGMRSTYVSTGLLPVEISTKGEQSVVLATGEHGSVDANEPVGGKLTVDIKPAVPLWFWVVLVGASFAPSLGSSLRFVGHEVPSRRAAVRPRHAATA